MRDAAGDATALELLREQRSRLADRLRPPWWYLAGIGVMYALVFAFPFAQRFVGLSIWAVFVVAAVVGGLLYWGWTRTTGIKMGFRNLSYPDSIRPVRYAIAVVSIGTIAIEHLLIERGLVAVAIVVAALAVGAEIALQVAALRGARREMRDGGGAA